MIKMSENRLLSEMRVLFGDWSILRMENNSILHDYRQFYTSAFVGEKLNKSLVHRMFII